MSGKVHLEFAKRSVRQICRRQRIRLIRVTGRLKSLEQCRAKLMMMPNGTFGALGGPCAALDRMGVRILVRDDHDLNVLVAELKRGMILCKDYINVPRRDGEILGKDKEDVYKGYHIFTCRITGVPIEFQLFTRQMRAAGIRLKRKYGNGYWKSRHFRERRVKLGDLR